MKKYQLILFLFLSAGCTLFKKNTKTIEESSGSHHSKLDLQAESGNSSLKSGQELMYKQDSAQEVFSIRFWPKGNFNFSPGGGFSGEFDSILMVGQQKHTSSTTKNSLNTELELGRNRVHIAQDESDKSNQKLVRKEEEPDLKSILFLLALAVLVIFLAIRWFFRPK